MRPLIADINPGERVLWTMLGSRVSRIIHENGLGRVEALYHRCEEEKMYDELRCRVVLQWGSVGP